MESKPLTTGEIAEHCHVTHRAVLKWVEEKKIRAFRTPGNHSRIHVPDFLDFLRRYHMPIPEAFKTYEGRKLRALIIDDESHMVKTIKRILLSMNQFDIEEAYDGFSGGEKFAEFKPDLIILDLKMPRLNGYEVCKHIRSKDRAVKILIVSGIVSSTMTKQVANYGANDYLAKPFKRNDFVEKIHQLMGSLIQKEVAHG